MDSQADLLIEIGTEELPPVALPRLAGAFRDGFQAQLDAGQIAFREIEAFAAPRRLALLVRGLALRKPDQEVVRRGPAIQAAFDAEGRPTKAALGFANSCGTEVGELAREETAKGSWLLFRSLTPGEDTTRLVPGMAEAALAGLPIPRRMRWGAGDAEFVRPVHWLCMKLGADLVEGRILGVESRPFTRGHRFHHPGELTVGAPGDYAEQLRQHGRVEPSFEERREMVRRQVQDLAVSEGLRPRIDLDLLDEVTALVEWPHALLCRFDTRFLEMPAEVLIESMQKNQKYFPLEDETGRLQAQFVVVANIVTSDPAKVQAGNERVIRPRFEDAAFFWSQDVKQPLSAFAERLSTVVFQEKLGTLAEKSERLTAIAASVAEKLGTEQSLVERAARLAKCDLVTSMVFELPTLQGVMGRYYAAHSGEPTEVCAALEEQYWPKFAGDRLPATPCGRALAIADRVDTLVGIFGIGLRPTGTKDPYGLRRAAIGVLRVLIETPLDIDLRSLLETASKGFRPGLLREDVVGLVLEYMLERLAGYYGDRGVSADTVEAVLRTGVTNPSDLDKRVVAVSHFRRLAAAESLAAANKRIRNILSKASAEDQAAGPVLKELLIEAAEQRLAEQVQSASGLIAPLVRAGDYIAALEALAELRPDVDRFFDEVMVMAEQAEFRRNRLRLLGSVLRLFLQVADISRLQ